VRTVRSATAKREPASQLSAASAGIAGGSEMITGRPRHESGNIGSIVVATGACVVVWATDVFDHQPRVTRDLRVATSGCRVSLHVHPEHAVGVARIVGHQPVDGDAAGAHLCDALGDAEVQRADGVGIGERRTGERTRSVLWINSDERGSRTWLPAVGEAGREEAGIASSSRSPSTDAPDVEPPAPRTTPDVARGVPRARRRASAPGSP
jgi:hypothetical protein